MGVLSKAQHNALKELARGETSFGGGFLYLYRTGKALVDNGLAIELEGGDYRCSAYDKRRRPYMKARITPKGREVLSKGGRYVGSLQTRG